MLDFVFYTTFSEDIQVNFEYLNLERAIDPILNVRNRDTSNSLLTKTPGILDRVRNSHSDYERVDEFKVNFESISKYVKHIKTSTDIKTNATNVLNNILTEDISASIFGFHSFSL